MTCLRTHPIFLAAMLLAGGSGRAATLDHVPNNAALSGTAATDGARVVRDGFYAAGDGGQAFYTGASAACPSAADNGYRVAASGGGCWTMDTVASRPNLLQWGAKADGLTNVVPMMQAAYYANVGPIHMPQGKYLLAGRVNFDRATVPAFYGDGWSEYPNAGTCPSASGIVGTWLYMTAATDPGVGYFHYYGGQVAVGSGGFSDMAFCQEQPAATPGWQPTAYSPIFLLNNVGNEVDFKNLYFYNSYDAVSTYNTARLHFTNIRGQILHSFLTGPNGVADAMFDLSDGDTFHFYPYWSIDENVMAYTERNAVLLNLGKVDGMSFSNFFGLGYQSCVKAQRTASGDATQIQFDNFYCDASQYPIWTTNGSGAKLTFSNATLDAADFARPVGVIDSECVRADGGGGAIIKIATLNCLGSNNAAVIANSTTGHDEIDIGSSFFIGVNCNGNGSCPGGGSPIFYGGNTSDPQVNAIRVSQTPVVDQAVNAPLFSTDTSGTYSTNTLFEYPGGYFLSQAMSSTGGYAHMGNFLPKSVLYITGAGTITGRVTVSLPAVVSASYPYAAQQPEAVISSVAPIADLYITDGNTQITNCAPSLQANHSVILKYLPSGGPSAATGWRCISQ